MSIYEHFEHAQNSALHEIRTLVLICQPWGQVLFLLADPGSMGQLESSCSDSRFSSLFCCAATIEKERFHPPC